MAIKNLSVGDIIGQSWNIVKKNVWIFAGTLLLLLLVIGFVYVLFLGGGASAAAISSSPENIGAMFAAMFGLSFILYSLVSTVLSAIFYLGYLKMALTAADGGEPTLSAFSISGRKVVNTIIAYILFQITATLGFCLCVVPGFIVYSRLYFFFFFIIEEDCGPIEALTKSWNATAGETWNIILLFLSFFLVNLLGAICCGIGLLITIPMMYIGLAITYRSLTVRVPEGDFESLADKDRI
jgi:uncharacterized membrane protein